MSFSVNQFMKPFLLLFVLFFAFSARAQVQADIRLYTADGYLFPDEAPFHYVLGDGVSFRDCPSDSCNILSLLEIGTRLTLLAESDSVSVFNGLSSKWYQADVAGKTGWVWGGWIAQQAFGSQTDPDVKFVAGYEKVIREPAENRFGQYYQIRAIRKGEQIAKIVLKSFAWELGGVQNIGPKGLDKLDDILLLNVPCTGGCGCLTGDMVIFWANDKFHYVADLKGSPDAEYSQYQDFVFPSDMEGEKGIIIKRSGGYEDPPEDEAGQLEYQHKVKRSILTEYFIWNGSNLVPSGRKSHRETYWLKN
jgi:hypothetical protein